MKLRLPHRLQAALVAALASVSFTTLSSGTLSAAFFFGSQAFAEEAADNTGATIDIGDTNLDPQAAIDEEEGKGEAKEPGSAPINQAGFNGIRGSSDDFDRQSIAESSIDTENVGTAGQANYGSTSADLPSNDLGFTSNSYASGSSNGSVVDSPVTSFTQAPQIAPTGGYSAAGTGSGSNSASPVSVFGNTGSGATGGGSFGSGISLGSVTKAAPTPVILGAADAELTTFTTTNSTTTTTNNYNAKGFAVVLNGPRLATTSTDVPITTCDLVYLNSITLGSLRAVPAAGVTLALADATGKVLSVSKDIVSSVNQSVTWTFTNTTVATDSTLYFYWLDSSKGIAVGNTLSDSDLASWNYAGNGNGGVSDYNGISGVATDNSSCGYLDSLSHISTANSRFAPKLTIVTSGPVPQDEYIWKAADTPAYWDEETNNWTLRGVDSEYVSGVNTIVNFNDGDFAKEVTVVGAIEAGTVNVGANYKFTVGTGDSLSISKLSVASGATATVENAGELSISTITGEGAFTKGGVGTLNLAGTNDFSGGLTVNGGVVHTTQVSALGSGTLTATGTGKIEIENTAPGNLTVLGDGTLRLMTTYAASSQQSNVELANIQAANLELGADEHHSSRFRNQNNPDLSNVEHLYFDGGQFWVSNAFTYGGTVTFNETVYKENRSQPDNKLNDAALRVNANVTLTGKVDVAHNTRFTWQASNLAVEFGGEVVGSGNLELAIYSGSNNTFRISGDASAYGGSITSASGVALDITSGGKLSIGSSSNLQGAVNVSGGTLDLTSSVNTGAFSMSGGTLKLADAVTFTSSGAISLTGGMLDLSSVTLSQGTYTLATSSTGSITYSGVDFTLNPSYVKSDYSLGVSGNSLVLTYNTPPKEGTFHVYILTGQSNSLGAVKDSPLSSAMLAAYQATGVQMYNSNITNYRTSVTNAEANPAWVQLAPQEPGGSVQADAYFNNLCMGPEYGFAYIMQKNGWYTTSENEDQDKLGVILASLDGGGNQYWLHDSATYANILQHVKDGLLAAKQQGYSSVSLDGLMYLQGESNDGTGAAAAATRYDDFIADLSEDLEIWMEEQSITGIELLFDSNSVTGEPRLGNGDRQTTESNLLAQATSKGMINADRNGIGHVLTNDLAVTNCDKMNVHYTGNSQLTIGARYAYAFAVQNGVNVGAVRGQDDSKNLNEAGAWWMEVLPTASDVATWDISSVSTVNNIADGQSITVGGIRIEEVYAANATTTGQGSVSINGGSINLGNASLESGSGITLVGGDLSISSTINAVANQTWSTGDHQLTTSGTVNIQNGATLTIAGDAEWQFNVVQGTGNLVVTNGATLSMTQGDLNNHSTGGSGYSDGNNGFLSSGYDLITLTGDNSSITINPAQITWGGALAGKDITLSADSKKLQILNGESTVYHVRDGVVVYNTATGITDATSIDINDMGSTGATLRLSTALANNVKVTSSGNGGAVKIDNGVTLDQGALGTLGAQLALKGDGIYHVSGWNNNFTVQNGYGLGSNVVLASDWTGTVQLESSTSTSGLVDFAHLANGSLSTVELKGLNGWTSDWDGTIAENLKLTDVDNNTAAWTNAASSSMQPVKTATLSGDWSGEGTFKLTNANRMNYTYTGDISEWHGKFQKTGNGQTDLTFSGSAGTVNASIVREEGTLNLIVGTDATFGADVTGINNFTTLAGTRVAFNGATTSINGPSSIGGTITNGGSMTLAGKITLTGSLVSDYEVYEKGSVEQYSGQGDYTGNGYLTTDSKFYLVKNATGGTLNSTATAADANITLSRTDNNSLVFQNKAEGNVYYVNGELNWGDDMGETRTTEVVVASDASLKLNSTVSKSIVGTGTVKIDAGDNTDYQYYNQNFLENFTGTVDVVSGNLQVGSNANKLANATLRVSGGEVRAHTNAFVHDIILAGGGIAGAGANETYSGKITLEADSYIGRTGGGEAVTLTGGLSGEYTLSTRGTSGATFNLNSATDIAGLALGAGTVNINNVAQVGTISGTGNVNVNGSLSLEETSTFTGNMIVATGATLALAGEEMLTLSGTLTLQAGSTLDLARIFETQEAPVQANLFQVAPKASSLLSVGGNSGDSGLLSGGLLGAATPAPGDYILATANSIGSLDGVELANIAQGYTGTLSTKDANGDKQLILTLAAASNDLIWDHSTNDQWDTTTSNWHASGTTDLGTAKFTQNDNVTFQSGAGTVALQQETTAGTMTLDNGANLTLNTNGNSLTVTDLDTLGTPSLTKEGAGSATFGGSDEEGVTLSGLNVKVGSAEFAEKVTVDGTKRVYVAAQGTNASAEFKGGLEYNGSDTYALAVYAGEGNQATLYGESDLGGKQIGIGKNAKLIIAENASVTSGGVKNSGNFESNGAVVLQDNATLTQQSGQFVTTDLTLGKGAVVNLNADNRDATVATIGSISGEGEIHISSQVRNRTYNIQGDIKDWTGAITQDSSAGSMTLNISGTDVVNADITNSAKTNPASILTLNLKDDMTVNGKVTYTAVAPIDMNVGDSGTAANVTFTNEVKVRNLNVAHADSSATFRGPTQINGTISGNGEMTVNSGSNTVTVEGANNLKGDTTVTAGTLQLNGGGSMGDVIVNGGKFNTTGAQAITLNRLSVTDGIAHVGNSGNVNLGTVSLTGGDLVLNTTVSAGSLTTTSGATLTFAGENMLTTTGDIDLSGGLQLDLSNITYRTDTSAVQTITLATTSGAITLDETQKTYTFLNTKTDVNKTSFTLRDDGANHLVLEVVYNDVTNWPDNTNVSYTYTGEQGKETHYDIKVGNTDPHGYNFSQTDDGVVEFNPNLFNNATHTYTDGNDIVMHSNTTIVVEEGNTVKLTGLLQGNGTGDNASGDLTKAGAGTLEMEINPVAVPGSNPQQNLYEGSVDVEEGTLHVVYKNTGVATNRSMLAAGKDEHVRVAKGATLELDYKTGISIPRGQRNDDPREGEDRSLILSASSEGAIIQNAYISEEGIRPDDPQDGGRARVDKVGELQIGNLNDTSQAVTIELADILVESVSLNGTTTIDNSYISITFDMDINNDVGAPNKIQNHSTIDFSGFYGVVNNTDVDKTSKINSHIPGAAMLYGNNKVEVGSQENGGVSTRTITENTISYKSDQYKGMLLYPTPENPLSLGVTLSDVDLPDDLTGYTFTLTFEGFNTSYLFEEASSEFIPLEDLALDVSLFIPAYAGGQWEELVASVQVKYDTTGNTVFMFEHIMTPEPTTGTLSLLALAALAARRRRK